ncbi:sensor domain-containing diguanylate cyclase [Alkalihalobacillus sp. MEB130]|uniref:sensor domain-containing diguanylate cyclase n=1 Tax=Alkalihalobacillus sp. MEB130 TaxID=2976704 RepID=UPI0028DF9673|nr:sensor domain-containing diguanylate cyclase [Alkalihalobacillus sp. MEB130]MDT8859888.1 sensor domain-containing diguanylate cyclase [Alkalihalobacillus sp. MEB130]
MIKPIAFSYLFLLSLYIIYLLFVGQFTTYMIVLSIFLIIPIIGLLRSYKIKARETKKTMDEVIELKAKMKEMEQEVERRNQIIHHLDLVHLEYDVPTDTARVSGGVEHIYQVSKEEFEQNIFLWQDHIHPEDMKMALHKEKQLLLGKSIKYTHRIQLECQKIKWVINSATPVSDSNGKLMKIYRTFHEITEQKEKEEQLQQLAFYDDLTELPNRKLLDIQLKKALARSKRHDHTLVTMFIDLDGFKNVNDTYGHESGDLLLKEVATRLNDSVREEDLIVRLGGDEFIIVCEEAEKEEAEGIANRIIEFVSKPFSVNEQELHVSPSIGISLYPEDGEDREELIQNADKAMYHAKRKGKGNFQFYNENLRDVQPRKFDIFEKLLKSVSKKRN